MKTLEWKNGRLYLLDQTRLPLHMETIECITYRDAAEAIKAMKVRGAPAIGVTAAYGIVLGVKENSGRDKEEFFKRLYHAADELKSTRPTAVNLFWAIDRMVRKAEENREKTIPDIQKILEREADNMAEEDFRINRKIGENGQVLLKGGEVILTHCNAGALATVDYGTALGVIRAAWENGKKVSVYADETRPYLQGARLTAWELMQSNIPVTLITDNMAGYFMKKGVVTAAIVGADRIAANGDTANKIGTYSVAVLARENNIPFYVAAPVSTLDFSIASGEEITIEERNEREVTFIGETRIAPEGVKVANPAFDVTPAKYITAIITEKGIVSPPYLENLKKMVSRSNV